MSPVHRTCAGCRHFGGPRRVYVTTDYAGLASRVIKAYKFGHRRFLSTDIARLMVATWSNFNDRADALIVPVPSATRRIRRRGFDHSARLAVDVAGELGLKYQPLLGRLGQAAQVGTRRSQRLKLPPDNFFVRSNYNLGGQAVLLVDDVLTTGATLRAAAKTLRSAGAKPVDALVFAKKL